MHIYFGWIFDSFDKENPILVIMMLTAYFVTKKLDKTMKSFD